jgi:N-methylhydantoinase A
VVKSLYQRFRQLRRRRGERTPRRDVDEASEVVAQGAFGQPIEERRLAFMRYVGQGHEIAVALPPRALAPDDVAAIRAAYDAEYTRFYDRPVPGSDVEILSFAVTVATLVEAVEPVAEVADAPAPAPVRTQRVRDTASGEVADWAVYDRDAMAPGAAVPGPCIVAEAETSTLVGPGWRCRVDGLGYLELTRQP